MLVNFQILESFVSAILSSSTQNTHVCSVL